MYNQYRASNNTIFSVIEGREKVDEAVDEIEKIIGSFDDPGTGIIFSFLLDQVKGVKTD